MGPKEALDITEIAGTSYTWCGTEPENIDSGIDIDVQIRAHADPVPAHARRVGNEIVVSCVDPLNSVATGQTAVIYIGTRVVGQFTISRTVSAVNTVDTQQVSV